MIAAGADGVNVTKFYELMYETFGPGSGCVQWDSRMDVFECRWTTVHREYVLERRFPMSRPGVEFEFRGGGLCEVGKTPDEAINLAIARFVMER